MRVKMKASMRSLTRMGLDLLHKQTKAASRETGKAFLSTMEANTELGRIEFAKAHLPVSEAAEGVWIVEDHIIIVYRNALFMVGSELQKTFEREKEYENEDAAKATREQLDEVKAQLITLGDQRDFFAEYDEEAGAEDESQFAFAGAHPGESP